jgi:pimeloyl-ACP methyl ester carboxylesterase
MPSIDVNGIQVSFQEAGTGEPVVFLHCSASTGEQWWAQFERLSRHHRVIAPDLFGCGESESWQGRGRLTLEAEAAIVEAFIDYCGEPVHLVGHSYGGALALRAALDYPDGIKTLTLIEPVAFHLLRHDESHGVEHFRKVRGVADCISLAVLCGDYQAGMGCFVDYWNGEGTWARMKDDKRAALAGRITRVVLDFAATTGEETTPAAYVRVGMPTLVIRGDRSPAPVRHLAEVLEDTLPDAVLETVQGAGHMLPMTHGGQVSELIADHLFASEPMGAWISHRRPLGDAAGARHAA